MRGRTTMFAALAIGALLAGSCTAGGGNTNTPQSVNPSASHAPVNLTLWSGFTKPEIDYLNSAIAMFEQKYPWIHVTTVPGKQDTDVLNAIHGGNGPDAVMLLLSTPKENHPWVPLYALGATVGSVIGCLFLYYISRRAGRRALEKFSASKQARVKELIERFYSSVRKGSPVPIPYREIILTARIMDDIFAQIHPGRSQVPEAQASHVPVSSVA